MKKAEKEAMTKVIKYLSTARLRSISADLDDWNHNNRLKRSSWNWGDNGNASERKRKEQYYDRDCSVKIGPYPLHYWSDVSMSRQNVYWSNGLDLSGMEASFTFANIHFLQDYIDELINKRLDKTKKQ
ncbi:MAG: hypothetical protein IJ198_13840 [Lachnospiraceae bacterium]|nr:hypothetical protein [Lachnospiraceae bacterium]